MDHVAYSKPSLESPSTGRLSLIRDEQLIRIMLLEKKSIGGDLNVRFSIQVQITSPPLYHLCYLVTILFVTCKHLFAMHVLSVFPM